MVGVHFTVKKEIEDIEGLIGGEYYDVPQVPDVMYFTDVGHAFHGAYWHNDFGTPRSYGCINLPLDVVVALALRVGVVIAAGAALSGRNASASPPTPESSWRQFAAA